MINFEYKRTFLILTTTEHETSQKEWLVLLLTSKVVINFLRKQAFATNKAYITFLPLKDPM